MTAPSGRRSPEDAKAGVDSLGALAREHVVNPRNAGRFAETEAGDVRSGEAGSAASGEFVRFHLRLVGGTIAEARYETLGEPALIAAASYLSTLLPGRPAAPDAVPAGLEIARKLELPRSRHGACLLVEDAVHGALGRARRR